MGLHSNPSWSLGKLVPPYDEAAPSAVPGRNLTPAMMALTKDLQRVD